MKKNFTYTNENTSQISFPLGGIGSGSIGLSGNGRLIDWEIFNRPNKKSTNGYSTFAIKAYDGENLIDYKILNGDFLPPYMGEIDRNKPHKHIGFGVGPDENTFAGFRHFKESSFTGEFPIAKIDFKDESFPGNITMEAFNPLIPLNDLDSSIPGAFFEITVLNTFEKEVEYGICLSVSSPFDFDQANNLKSTKKNVNYIKIGNKSIKDDDPKYGDITIATDCDDISFQEYWYRGFWKNNLEMFLNDFTLDKRFLNRNYKSPSSEHLSIPFLKDTSSLCAHIKLKPKEKKAVKFIITWNFPNMYNYWEKDVDKTPWKNYYSTIFKDSTKSALYSFENWERLVGDTRLFKEALFSSSLDEWVLDAVSSCISVLKSPTCLRLTDGTFYGFEGCGDNTGYCEGSCTHVWNYAYALPYLFPKLEQSMRTADFKYNQLDDGYMRFRLHLPLGEYKLNELEERPCVDGQMGGIIKSYRDWKISGDGKWLKDNWPYIKKSLEFAWAKTNKYLWDPDKAGVITGRQHHTLDMELFCANSWLNGFYLAALKAGSEIAKFIGDDDSSKLYLSLFEKGKQFTDSNLFNGQYYFQNINLSKRELLEPYNWDPSILSYWNNEKNQISYQIGEGCEIDQVVAGWHANLCGLGEIFDKAKVKSALKSIYKYNFKSMRDVTNVWRLFSINDEKGVIICSWPEGTSKPSIPLTYSYETMTGFEYAVSCHMLQEGMIDESLEIVKAIRDRFDGIKRNPWNEFECGSNYARSMAAYSLLLTYSGFRYDAVENHLEFYPINLKYNTKNNCDNLTYFFTSSHGWGTISYDENEVIIKILYGRIDIKTMNILNKKIVFDDIKSIDKNMELKILLNS